MVAILFVMGILIGILAGGVTCVRFLRHEIAADIGPRLKTIQTQLDRLDSEINLALATNLNAMSERYTRRALPPPLPGDAAPPG